MTEQNPTFSPAEIERYKADVRRAWETPERGYPVTVGEGVTSLEVAPQVDPDALTSPE